MVTLLLSLIIALLSGFIIWLLNMLFKIDAPEKVAEPSLTPNKKEVKAKGQKSVVGATSFQPLKPPPPPKPRKVIATEDLDEVFKSLEFEAEVAPEPQYEKPSDEELEEVIDTDGEDGNIENEKIQRETCVDYEQLESAATKILRGKPIDINDAEALSKVEGTSIDDKIFEKMPHYLYVVQSALSNR